MNSKGSASVVALWVLAMLTVLVAGFSRHVRTEIRATSLVEDKLQARSLALSGVEWAKALLENGLPFHAHNQIWSARSELLRQELDNGWFEVRNTHTVSDTSEYWGMVDEERKINLNTAPPEVLKGLPGMDADLVSALLDWRDIDDIPEPGGAEETYYETLRVPYSCKNEPLENVLELLLIRGFTPQVVEDLLPYVTVFGNGRVNINTASKPVLVALGFSEIFTDDVIAFRAGPDGDVGTRDDGFFENGERVVSDVARYIGIQSRDQLMLEQNGRILTTRSHHFQIEVTGYTDRGAVHRITAVVQLVGYDDKAVVFWHEGTPLL